MADLIIFGASDIARLAHRYFEARLAAPPLWPSPSTRNFAKTTRFAACRSWTSTR